MSLLDKIARVVKTDMTSLKDYCDKLKANENVKKDQEAMELVLKIELILLDVPKKKTCIYKDDERCVHIMQGGKSVGDRCRKKAGENGLCNIHKKE